MGTGRPGRNARQMLLLHRTNEGVQMEPGDADVGIQMHALPLRRSTDIFSKDASTHCHHLGEKLLSMIRAVHRQLLDISETLHGDTQDVTGVPDVEEGRHRLRHLQRMLSTMQLLAMRDRFSAMKVLQAPPTVEAKTSCRTRHSRDIGTFAEWLRIFRCRLCRHRKGAR